MIFSILKRERFKFYWLCFFLIFLGTVCTLTAMQFFLTPDDRIRGLVKRIMNPLAEVIATTENSNVQAATAASVPATPFGQLNPVEMHQLIEEGWVIDLINPPAGKSVKPHTPYHLTLTVKEEPKEEEKKAYAARLREIFQKIKLVPFAVESTYGKFVALVFSKEVTPRDEMNPLTEDEKKILNNLKEFSPVAEDAKIFPHLSLIKWANEFATGDEFKEYIKNEEKFTQTKRDLFLPPFLEKLQNLKIPSDPLAKATRGIFRRNLLKVYEAWIKLHPYLYLPPIPFDGESIDPTQGLMVSTFVDKLLEPKKLDSFKKQFGQLVVTMNERQPKIPMRMHFSDVNNAILPILYMIKEFIDEEKGIEEESKKASKNGPAQPVIPALTPVLVYDDTDWNTHIAALKNPGAK